MRKLLIINYFFFSALLLPAFILAAEDAPIARIEHRPVQNSNFQHGQINHTNAAQYHPAAREDARHDVNRAAETNAANNAGAYGAIPQAVPVFPTNLPATNANPGTTTNSGNSVNVYSVPQSAAPIPQH